MSTSDKIAVFPGSFDPITLGHKSLVIRSLSLFDKIVVGIGVNAQKTSYFDLETRIKWIQDVFKAYDQIEVTSYEGLTVNFCESISSRFIIRGLRNERDFRYETEIAQANLKLNNQIETIFLPTEPEFSAINSSIVRDIIRNGGDASAFIPNEVSI